MQSLPIGISQFPELREEGCVYVDKTKHVYSLLKKKRRTFLSRPRRFGKSLLVSTLEAALQGKKDLFEGLWIHSSDYHFKPQGVIHLDFSQLEIDSKKECTQDLKCMLVDIGKTYGIVLDQKLGLKAVFRNLISSLSEAFENGPVAILIDEYDYPISHTLHTPELAIQIRDVLKGFSSVIKAQSKLVQFVFVTGVSAFSKAGLSSGLNNLENLTMNRDFFDICGYTDEEVDHYFKEYMMDWSTRKQIPYKQLREDLKSWYNGYRFEENAQTVYSPFSFTCALQAQKILNFWFESATPQFLLDELRKAERQEECKLLELDQIQGTEDLLQTFEIENLPLPALLFQMGYLTIESYNSLSRHYSLTYPNQEVRTSLNRHLIVAVTK